MLRMVKYIKIYLKFPSDIEAFWDDTHYIMHVDPRGDISRLWLYGIRAPYDRSFPCMEATPYLCHKEPAKGKKCT